MTGTSGKRDGAVATFVGLVRNHHQGRRVLYEGDEVAFLAVLRATFCVRRSVAPQHVSDARRTTSNGERSRENVAERT